MKILHSIGKQPFAAYAVAYFTGDKLKPEFLQLWLNLVLQIPSDICIYRKSESIDEK